VHALAQNGFGGQAVGRALEFGCEMGLHQKLSAVKGDGNDMISKKPAFIA
jgi:hypothetical protein